MKTRDDTLLVGPPIQILGQPEYKASVEIAHDFFINTVTPQPNWWWRLWQWVLLGWEWKPTTGMERCVTRKQ